MTDRPLQLTMRELRSVFFLPTFWAALAGVALALGLVGPFGTFDSLPLGARLAYWSAIAASTYFVGMVAIFILVNLPFVPRPPRPIHFAAAGIVGAIPVWLVVLAINGHVFAGRRNEPGPIGLLFYCIAITTIVAVLTRMTRKEASAGRAAAGENEPAGFATGLEVQEVSRPKLLDRLPPHLRAELLHLTMQDHYVSVSTARGTTLILLRFADAIAETEGVEGLRIHRSHWVARAAIAGVERRAGRVRLVLSDGTTLPVSRPYLAAVRAAGVA